MKKVVVVIGVGSIGQAIARRVGAGKYILLADLRQENADMASKVLSEAGFRVTTAIIDVSSRASVHALVEKATALATTPFEELLKLPMLQPDQVKDSLHAYQLSKRGNSLRVMFEAVHWGRRAG
jgi:NAD(P)-dependent dehydrogenase (short-subunit alcohol dehydrogenase family)